MLAFAIRRLFEAAFHRVLVVAGTGGDWIGSDAVTASSDTIGVHSVPLQ